MKKIISILACVCLLLSAMVIPVSAAESVTYKLPDYAEKAAVTNYSKALDDVITIGLYNGQSTGSGYFHSKYLRVYADADAQIISTKSMASVEIVMGDKAGNYTLSTSTDGSTWTPVIENAAFASKGKVSVAFDTPTKYVKITPDAQMRWDTMTVTFAEESGEESCAHEETTATSNGDETHSVVCKSCGETISTAAECVDSDKDAACDTCAGAVELPFDPTGKTPAEIVDAAYALESGETIENVTLTGVVTSIGTAYNASYKNVSLTIAVNDTDKTMYCYRLTADEDLLETLAGVTVEDTITVTGTIGVYNGAPQFQAGAKMTACEKGDLVVVVPEDPKEIVDEAFALEAGTSLLYEATLQGEIVEINEAYSEQYKNMQVTIEVEGTTGMHNLLCYRMKAAEGQDAAALKVGDVIAVTGTIKNYNGTIEFDSGCTFVLVEAAVEETFEGTDPENPIQLAVNESIPANITEIKVPAEGTVFVQAADANGIFHVTSADGTYMLINGQANQATADAEYDLTLCGYEMVNIYNPGTETITLYVFLEAGAGEVAGTWDNPEVLEFVENPWMPSFPPSAEASTELEAGNQGYFYKVVAPKDCIFVINVSAIDAEWNGVGYQYSVTNNTTGWQSDFVAKAADVEDYYDSAFIPVNAGDEIIINAGTFNPEDVWNAPAGTLNVRINTTNVGASDYPEILTETGTYTATVEAGSQGYYYEWTAEKDGTATITMNDENWTYVVNNLTSYVYGDTQWSDSDPVLSTYEVEVKAGDLIGIMVNTYDPADSWNAPAGTVNWTLGFAEKVIDAKFSVADAEAAIGKEFTVTIDVSNNPGIVSAKLNVNYDANILELVDATAGDFTNGSVENDGVDLPNYNFGPTDANPFVINWVDGLATENCTTNGVFVTLTFRVKDDAAVGTTEISVTYEDGDIFDVNLNDVEFGTTAGTVTIIESTGTPGDANGDGNVNGRDYAMILQYLNDWPVDINLDNSDVNGDGNVNGRDYALLLQYLNDWPVELK